MTETTYFIPGASPAHVSVWQPFSTGAGDDLVQYPANWLEHAVPADLAAIGAAEVVTEGAHGDPRLVVNDTVLDGPVRRLVATPRSAEEVMTTLLGYLSERRWQAEIGGTTWEGWALPTDERSQQKYAAEALAVQIGSRVDGSPWKFPHGFELLANAQVIDMASTARGHVLACYAKEAELAAQIVAGTLATFDAIDAAFAAVFPVPVAP